MRKRTLKRSESGQATVFVMLTMGIFLLGAMAFAIDLGNMWFNRQSAQTAADAACTAGVMDLLVDATNGLTGLGNFTAGTNPKTINCFTTFPNTSSTAPSPCVYAALNGFSSSVDQGSTSFGSNVTVDFPDPTNAAYQHFNFAPSKVAPTSLMRVTIANNIPTFFAGLLRGRRTQSVGATSICGVINANSPIPILVLNPTIPGALSMNGGGATSKTGDIAIAGGPSRSIQVNSDGSGGGKPGSPVSIKGTPSINLCAGGNTYCGSSMGVWGSETTPGGFWNTVAKCSTVNTLCTATQTAPLWNSPSAPIADPLESTAAPQQPNFAGAINPPPINIPPGSTTDGCPDPGGCYEYTPGSYTSGICVGGPCANHSFATAIFKPGIYYLAGSCKSGVKGSLCELSGSCLRPSSATGDGSGGTIFYFSDTNSVFVAANGGGCTGVTVFDTAKGGQGNGVKCTSTSQVPGNLPATLTGSVLTAPCLAPDSTTGLCSPNCSINPGTNGGGGFGDPQGAGDEFGVQRGILFFQNRSVNAGNNPSWGGGGSMLLAGTMYFHQCVTTGGDTGLGCVSGAYNDLLSLGGTPSSSTYVLGDVIADQLSLSGNAGLTMDLNPSATFTTLKAALLQ